MTWAGWSVWSGCDAQCGVGTATRSRVCEGDCGNTCDGPAINTTACVIGNRVIRGGIGGTIMLNNLVKIIYIGIYLFNTVFFALAVILIRMHLSSFPLSHSKRPLE